MEDRQFNPRDNVPDYIGDKDETLKLVRKIKMYHWERGRNVDVWAEKEGHNGQNIWVIRSNIKISFPPKIFPAPLFA